MSRDKYTTLQDWFKICSIAPNNSSATSLNNQFKKKIHFVRSRKTDVYLSRDKHATLQDWF
ncbi:MAG: hypothetical protein ACRC2R_10080 [Xenococcaceae cyanobacterium]